MKRRQVVTVALLLLGGAAYFGTNQAISSNQRRASVSVYNKRAGGVSIFAEFMNQLEPASATMRKSPLLYSDDLEDVGAFMLLSPTNDVTTREGEIIADWVREGGTLVLSVHDLSSSQRAKGLLQSLSSGANVIEDKRFRNGQSVLLSPKQDTFVFKADETYEFYSPVQLDWDACRGGSFECYVREFPHGKGKVLLLAGLPFFGNVLVGRQANKKATLALADALHAVQIDEFHHFFTDQTLWDLLWRPRFSIPILGSILGALLLLAFGHSEFHERSSEGGRAEKPPRTLHGLSESIVYRVFEKASAFPAILGTHREFLARLFPGKRKEIDQSRHRALGTALGQKEFLLEARRLLSSHRKWMKGER